jgi:putative membrane protein
MAFGFAIARFGLFLREVAQVGHVHGGTGIGSAWFGVVLVVIGMVTNAAATVRYSSARRALDEGRVASPDPRLVYLLGFGTAVAGAAMAAMLARTLGE